jgi:LysM repeat protein
MFVRILIVTFLVVGLWALFARDSSATGSEHTYRVQPGDTLWSIAATGYAGDPREGVWKLERRNHLNGATIVPGQVLHVPSS